VGTLVGVPVVVGVGVVVVTTTTVVGGVVGAWHNSGCFRAYGGYLQLVIFTPTVKARELGRPSAVLVSRSIKQWIELIGVFAYWAL
jgi:hypothetical protein